MAIEHPTSCLNAKWLVCQDIANALNPLEGVKSGIPSLDVFLTEVDVALDEVLLGLSVVIDGVLLLVGAL